MADRTEQTLNVYEKGGSKIASGSKGAKSVVITGLAPNTVVNKGDYQVTFSDTTGAESDKVDVPAFTVSDVKASAPTIKTATPGQGKIDVTLTASANTGSEVTNYKVYYKLTSGGEEKSIDLGKTLTGSITSLEAQEYTLSATATNGAGESTRSATKTATPTA